MAAAPATGRARRRNKTDRTQDMAAKLDHGDDSLGELHEINVTPFIDVMLVLLIIFMIAAPLATVDISVDLPSSTAERQPRPDKPLFVTLKSDLSVTLGNDTVQRNGIGAALDSATSNDREQRVFLRADKSVPYGELMTLMNELRTAGYLHVALVGLESVQKP
jgi:biopolymer transport protein ExbD